MNNRDKNVVNTVKSSMTSIKGIGRFLGLTMKNKSKLDPLHIKNTYAMRFENATLDLDMIINPQTNTQVVNGFRFT